MQKKINKVQATKKLSKTFDPETQNFVERKYEEKKQFGLFLDGGLRLVMYENFEVPCQMHTEIGICVYGQSQRNIIGSVQKKKLQQNHISFGAATNMDKLAIPDRKNYRQSGGIAA